MSQLLTLTIKNWSKKFSLDSFLFLASLTFFSVLYIPWVPYMLFSEGLDPSWLEALHYIFEIKKQFGTEIVFTYGPYGFLAFWMYHPANHPLVCLFYSFFFLLYAETCWSVIKKFLPNPWGCFVLFMVLFLISLPPHENFFLSMGFLTFLALNSTDNDRFVIRNLFLSVALAVISLIKISYMFISFPIILFSILSSLLSRRTPWVGICFALPFLLWWSLAGQSFLNIGRYFINSWEIISGYAEAMAFPKSPAFNLPMFLYIANSALFVLAALFFKDKTVSRLKHVCFLLLFVWFLFLNFKISFVRMDSVHLRAGFLGLLSVGVLCFPFFWRSSAHLLGRISLVVLLLFLGLSTDLCLRKKNASLLNVFSFPFSALPAQIHLIRSVNFARIHQELLSGLSKNLPLPPGLGSVDSYPMELSFIFAHHLDYNPRPTIQGYVAYTAKLASLNAAHLQSPSAPDSIFLSFPACGNDCLESFIDSLSWPEIATRYSPLATSHEMLLLEKIPNPKQFRLRFISSVKAHWGETVQVPKTKSGLVWARLEARPSLLNKLLGVFYKPVPAKLRLKNRIGLTREVYFNRHLAAAGFLLSPSVAGPGAFFGTFYEKSLFPENFIQSEISVLPETNFSAEKFFDKTIGISFFELEIIE